MKKNIDIVFIDYKGSIFGRFLYITLLTGNITLS